VDRDERSEVERTLSDLASRLDTGELTRALDEFGWDDLLRSEPPDAVDALFSAQGRAGSWSAAFHDVLAAASDLPGFDRGGAAVLVPCPGSDCSAESGGAVAAGLLLGPRPEYGSVIAVIGQGDATRLFDVPRELLSVDSARGLDDRLPVQRVTAVPGAGDLLAEGDAARQWWSAVVAAGRRALCFELCGAMEAMIDLAVTHATERYQFGRPVGSFQAVRHRLAESRVAVSGAHAAARASFDEPEPMVAALAAKVVAGRAQRAVAAHCQQVLGGIGFTAEHPFHRYLFRATVADRVLGSATELAPELGRALIDRGEPVRLAEL
jgi:hypothetical protein